MTTRRLAAILAADVVGFSKLIGEDEAGTLAALREIRKGIVNPVLAEHGGRIFKLMGDGMLAEFPSAVQALRAAIGIQERLRQRNAEAASGKRIEVRIGVHQGDVVVEGTDLLGAITRSPRRPEEQRLRNGETERPAALRLTQSSNLVGCSTGRSPGFAAQNLHHIFGCAAEKILKVGGVANEAASLHRLPPCVYGWQLLGLPPDRQGGDSSRRTSGSEKS